jgi:hypothetical protein
MIPADRGSSASKSSVHDELLEHDTRVDAPELEDVFARAVRS